MKLTPEQVANLEVIVGEASKLLTNEEYGEALNAETDTIITLCREWRERGEALEFYADPETYDATTLWTDSPCGAIEDDFSEDHGHPDYDRPMLGARARAALKGADHDKD